MYQSDIFCLFSNQSLIIDTEISKIISLAMVIHFFIFPQIIVLGSKKRGGALIGGGAINGENTVVSFSVIFLHFWDIHQPIENVLSLINPLACMRQKIKPKFQFC